MNQNQFQVLAKQFRAGKISLQEFTQQVLSREGDESAGFTGGDDRGIDAPQIKLPPRNIEGHKGTFGRVLVIGGSVGMAGAPALSAMAALRCGAGSVTVATPEICLPVVASFSPCLMTVALKNNSGKIDGERFETILELIEKSDLVAIGPGLGTSEILANWMLKLFMEVPCPMVFDADAINGLAAKNDVAKELAEHAGVRILTPHPGEFQTLCHERFSSRKQMCQAADRFAADSKSIVVLKGHETHVTDGIRSSRNPTGNSGMATAGSGDVLTGLIAGLVAQKMDSFEGAVAACYLHGLAGDLAAKQLSEYSLMATDIVESLPNAFLKLATGSRSKPKKQ